MKIFFFVGTAAELIKVYPLILEAKLRSFSWKVLASGQSAKNLEAQLNDFGILSEDVIWCENRRCDLKSGLDALLWFMKALFVSKKTLRERIGASSFDLDDAVFIVHGDTLSTLMGSIYAKRLGLKLCHVEAGMRSHDLWNPFPEEICRKLVTRLATLHFAPGEKALRNLIEEKAQGSVVDTRENTIVDTIECLSSDQVLHPSSGGKFVLANIHRFENLLSKERVEIIISTLLRAAQDYPVILVAMPNTQHFLDANPQMKTKLLAANVSILPRQSFSKFVPMLKNCEYLITDGGSNQQEAHYLGKPCLLMRSKTEGAEGLRENCVLSGFDKAVIESFLANFQIYARPGRIIDGPRPTEIIFMNLPVVWPSGRRGLEKTNIV